MEQGEFTLLMFPNRDEKLYSVFMVFIGELSINNHF